MTGFILGFVFVIYVVMAVLLYVSREKFCEIFPTKWERALVFVFSPVLIQVAILYGVIKKFEK